jgi:exodeoxyribonuclease V beta subunit
VRPLRPLELPLHGLHLIEASAGTGKTYTITTLFVRLLVEQALPVDRILVVTFTEAATAELQGRVRDRIVATLRMDAEDELAQRLVKDHGDEVVRSHLRQALRDFDECAISTIHGFCSRMLTENAFESGVAYDTALERDEAALYREIASDFWVNRVAGMDPLLVDHLRKQGVSPDSLAELADEVVSQPDRGRVPDAVPVEDVAPLFRERAERAAAMWRAHRDEIEDLLTNDAGLKRSTYRLDRLAGLLARADAWFASELRAPFDIGDVDKFSTTSLHASVKKSGVPIQHACFDAIDELREAATPFDAQVVAFRLELAAYALEEHRRRKQHAATRTFDDMLQRLDEAVVGPGGDRLCRTIRARFGAALIDEFQDTDRTQYRIFHRVYGGSGAPLVLIGDPKQSIYAFRGADVFSYLRAAQDASGRAWTLDTNWRSSPRMIQAVNTLFEGAHNPFVFDDIAFSSVKPQPGAEDSLRVGAAEPAALQLRLLRREGKEGKSGQIVGDWHKRHLPSTIANDVAHLLASRTELEGRPLEASDIAVLVRTNRQALELQVALRARRIPAVLRSDFSVFESPQADELHALLAAVAEPGRTGAVRAALATDLIGLTGDELAALDEDDPRWERWLTRFVRWRDLWDRRGFVRMFRAVLDHPLDGRPLHARLLELDDGARRLTNLNQLAELLHDSATRGRLGIRGLLRWLRRQLDGDGDCGDAAQLRLETDQSAVQLVTVHKSKGLEYPVVYCPYLWNSGERGDSVPFGFHDQDGTPWLDVGSDDLEAHQARCLHESLAEAARVAYVALTRAKHLAIILWGGFYGGEKSALAPILHGRTGEPLAKVRARLKNLDDDEIRADLDALAATADGTIGVSTLDEAPAPPYRPEETEEGELAARIVRRELPLWRRTSSFSGLVADQDDDGRDHDAFAEAASRPKAAPVGPPAHLVGFPGGRRAGSCFHTIYEHASFADREDLQQVTAERLGAFGYDAVTWSGPVAEAIGASLATDVGGFTLAELTKKDRLDELEFVFPAEGAQVSADQIAAVMRLSDAFPDGYLRRVADLGFVPLRGFLKGFIDLVFCRHDRWYVVDYKSNRLGDHMAAYDDAAMADEMAHHHYFLQYHLYVVALHRLLRYRIPGYDYERDFGAALYLFFRGMSPANGPRYGVFRDRPRAEMIEALSALFDHGTGEDGP